MNWKKVVTTAFTMATLTIPAIATATEVCLDTYLLEQELPIVYAEGSPDDGQNYAENVFDYDANTRFSTNVATWTWGDVNGPQTKHLWIGLDQIYTVTGIAIWWYKGNERTNTFKVFGGAWQHDPMMVFQGTSSKIDDFEYYPLTPSIGAGVMVVFDKNSATRRATSEWMSINEITVYGYSDLGQQLNIVFGNNFQASQQDRRRYNHGR